eukprot:102728-Pelagomonas_calceolata.AAC.1
MDVPLFWKELTGVTDLGSRITYCSSFDWCNKYCIMATRSEPLFVRETREIMFRKKEKKEKSTRAAGRVH